MSDNILEKTTSGFIVEKIKVVVRTGFAMLRFIPDVPYLKFYYRLRTGRKLNLENPQGFNEKLNWRKLYDRNPIYTQMADKLLVRDIVKERIGEGYSIPLLGHWNSFDEIDFDILPESFVLKCNHDSGSVLVIKDKNKLSAKDKKKMNKHFSRRLKVNPWWMAREWPYKNIKPCIIAEKYMDGGELKDYKFLCFDGEPKVLYVISNMFNDRKREDYYDMDGNTLDMYGGIPASENPPALPDNFEKMKELACKLSEGFPMVRVDLFEQNGNIYFAEYTFFNNGGTRLFEPDEWEQRLGDWTNISRIKGKE